MPGSGFESFSTQVHGIIAREGIGAYYVFDCLSDLLSAWATDLMIGNFFRITCPYLFQLDTIAYFGLIRSRHSYKTVARIRETTQLLMDVYNTGTDTYVHPLKVLGRYSPTMFLPHKKTDESFIPVTSSMDLAKLTSYITGKSTIQTRRNLDSWDRLFMEVQDLLRRHSQDADKDKALELLCSVMIGREQRILDLAKKTLIAAGSACHQRAYYRHRLYRRKGSRHAHSPQNSSTWTAHATGGLCLSPMILFLSAPMFFIPISCQTAGGRC